MVSRRRALLLLKPEAHSEYPNLPSALKRLEEHGIDCTELDSEDFHDRPAAIARHADADMLIVGAGDGTLNTAAQALRDSDLKLGILPLGTASDLARTLCIPPDLTAAADVIGKGRTVPVDLGLANDHAFFNVAHIGLAAEVPRFTRGFEKRVLGPLGYLVAVFRALRRFRAFHAKVCIDGQQHRFKCDQISVGNGRNYGGGMVIDHEARIDDATLDLLIWRRRSWLRMLALGLAMRQGWQRYYSNVLAVSAQQIEVETSRKLRLAADGEEIGHTPAAFRVLSAKLQVHVGPEYKEPSADAD